MDCEHLPKCYLFCLICAKAIPQWLDDSSKSPSLSVFKITYQNGIFHHITASGPLEAQEISKISMSRITGRCFHHSSPIIRCEKVV